MKRTPLKRGSKPLKRTKLKKMSEEKKASLPQEIADTASMWSFFLTLWYELKPEERVCYETGRQLLGVPLTIYFHHVLPKETYPQYKYCKWNIVLLTWMQHDQAEINIDKTPKVKALRDELLKKHQNGEL